MISEGFDYNKLPYLPYVFIQRGLRKHCRPRSNAASHGLGSKLFAIHPAILYTYTGSKMDLLKRSIR